MELFYGTSTGLYTLHLPIISSVWRTNISLQKTGKTKAGKISTTTLGGMWRSVFFTNFSGKVILYYTPISTIWRPHTVFHVLLYTSFIRLLPLQSCLTFFPLKYRSIKSCFLFSVVECPSSYVSEKGKELCDCHFFKLCKGKDFAAGWLFHSVHSQLKCGELSWQLPACLPLSKMMPSSLCIPSSPFGTLSRLLGSFLPGARLFLHPSGLFFGGTTVSFYHFSF